MFSHYIILDYWRTETSNKLSFDLNWYKFGIILQYWNVWSCKVLFALKNFRWTISKATANASHLKWTCLTKSILTLSKTHKIVSCKHNLAGKLDQGTKLNEITDRSENFRNHIKMKINKSLAPFKHFLQILTKPSVYSKIIVILKSITVNSE